MRQRLRSVLLGISVTLTAISMSDLSYADTDQKALENILVSRQDNMGVLRFLPRCRMRYLMHSPPAGGQRLRIRLTLTPECQALLNNAVSESYAVPKSSDDDIRSITFDAVNRFSGTVTIEFSEPRTFSVRPASNGWVEIRHDLSRRAEEFADAQPFPLPVPPAATAKQPPPSVIGARKSGVSPPPSAPSARRSSAASGEYFLVQLGVFADPNAALIALANQPTPYAVEARTFNIAEKTWHDVFVGPYQSEQQAAEVRNTLASTFPDSWVRALDSYEGYAQTVDAPTDQALATVAGNGDSLDDEASAALLAQARGELLEQRYSAAASTYRRVIAGATPENTRRAREYLGIALERSGQREAAIAEYRAWLADFDGSDAAGLKRVSARLVGLQQAGAQSSGELLVRQAQPTNTNREFSGAIAQYYRRAIDQRIDDGDGLVSASALYNYADLSFRQTGERFDLLARASGSYVLDNNSESIRQENAGWVTDAYLRVNDTRWNVDATFGRQRVYGRGMLTRFDGVSATYRHNETYSAGAVAGIPIDSVRYVGNRDRFAYAINGQWNNLAGLFDISAYAAVQNAGDFSDREAFGAEVSYSSVQTDVFAWFDYDWSFQALNHLIVNAEHRFNNQLSAYALFETGKSNTLSTRNALTGQVARTLDELAGQFTEGQMRTLAIDRTPDADRFGVGVDYVLNEQTTLTLDLTRSSQDATAASGGVAALAAVPDRTSVTAAWLKASAFTEGDFARVAFTAEKSDLMDSKRVLIDWRRPAFWGLRLNPVISIAERQFSRDGSTQLVVQPAIRLFYRWRQRFLVELEAGGEYSNRELASGVVDPFIADGEEELLGNYLTIGYRMEF